MYFKTMHVHRSGPDHRSLDGRGPGRLWVACPLARPPSFLPEPHRSSSSSTPRSIERNQQQRRRQRTEPPHPPTQTTTTTRTESTRYQTTIKTLPYPCPRQCHASACCWMDSFHIAVGAGVVGAAGAGAAAVGAAAAAGCPRSWSRRRRAVATRGHGTWAGDRTASEPVW